MCKVVGMMKTYAQLTPAEIAGNIAKLAITEINSRSKLGEEIGYYLGVQTENEEYSGKPDYVDAVFQTECFAEDNEDRAMLKLARSLLIRAGYYRIMPQSEIDSTVVSLGAKWAFKQDGVAYTLDYSASEVAEFSP